MFIHYRTRGFVLKKINRGEADQLFTIYTEDFGKLEILGKAIRKIKSKLRSGLEPFYLSEIEFIQGKGYKTLTDVVLIEKFGNIRRNLKRLKAAYRISDVLDDLIRNQEPDEKIWQLLAEVFEKLNSLKIENCKLEIVYYYFFWNFLSLLGYQPQLRDCSLCQKKLSFGKLYFSPKEKGIICPDCFKKNKSGKEVDVEIFKILRIILEKNWQILARLKIEEKHLKGLNSFSKNYLSVILEEIK